ncbi:hypothetical protein F4821DRAFT_239697 [Hypoxylon rubiginosum]|uniref:Uncharacterized protein n=1 Tax=Hypoxylon rubiginosum TaxID=110542 RepID=A0ACC0CZG0_9PEZI|nr:hypothetical protein F4821DRAFT_239697 [Hypoxylon rubiginosum]
MLTVAASWGFIFVTNLLDAGIPHQDISDGNIIIVDDQEDEEPKEILIDLGSAIELAERAGMDDESEVEIVGTRPFMDISVLDGERHTYRHDLESFLYVLLWVVITNHTGEPLEESKLRQQSSGD